MVVVVVQMCYENPKLNVRDTAKKLKKKEDDVEVDLKSETILVHNTPESDNDIFLSSRIKRFYCCLWLRLASKARVYIFIYINMST